MADRYWLRFQRIPNADHGLMAPGQNWQDVQKEYDAVIAWFERR